MSVPLSSGLLFFSPVTHAHISKNSCFFLSHSFSPPQHHVSVSWVQKCSQVSKMILTKVFKGPFCFCSLSYLFPWGSALGLGRSCSHAPHKLNDPWLSPVWYSSSRYSFSLLLCRWAFSPAKAIPKMNRLADSSVYVGGLLIGTWDPLMPWL